jgi:uncharacterized membrane protein
MAIALSRVALGRPRLLAGLLCGLTAAPLLPARLTGAERGILAWDIGVTVFLALTAGLFLSEHSARMAADAERQQEGEWTIFALTVAGTIASFAAIIGEFSHTGDLPKAQRGLHVALVAYTLFASWLMTHTTFALRYAHEFYSVTPGLAKVGHASADGGAFDGGLEFPGEKRPDYLDFFYFALVLGMTFQVSDVQITARKFRRLATVHGLLGFLFNTVILALTVNIAAGLL